MTDRERIEEIRQYVMFSKTKYGGPQHDVVHEMFDSVLAQIDKLNAALRFYANPSNWEPKEFDDCSAPPYALPQSPPAERNSPL